MWSTSNEIFSNGRLEVNSESGAVSENDVVVDDAKIDGKKPRARGSEKTILPTPPGRISSRQLSSRGGENGLS